LFFNLLSDRNVVLPPTDVPPEELKSDRQKYRLGKRKAVSDLLNSTREDLFSGEFDRYFFHNYISQF